MKYRLNTDYYSTHAIIERSIKSNSDVLDVGCASGYFAQLLKQKNCKVWGLDNDEKSLNIAQQFCHRVNRMNLENGFTPNILPSQSFDYILFLDVLEHLKTPENLLIQAKNYLKPDGKIIISLPNSATLWLRLQLLTGNFNYTETGILDKTHLRFYTFTTFRKLLENHGFKIIYALHNVDLGILPGIGRILKRLPLQIQYLITKLRPQVFATQMVFICQKS